MLVFLIAIWAIGIIELFGSADVAELIVDLIIVAGVLVAGFALTRAEGV